MDEIEGGRPEAERPADQPTEPTEETDTEGHSLAAGEFHRFLAQERAREVDEWSKREQRRQKAQEGKKRWFRRG